MSHRTTYRPDIDGLRAIAVLLVVASHLHVPHLAGGYVGVDVFFVISGYLISSIIVPQISSNTFSLAAFYERRLRRIAPALFFMLACTIPFARHFLFPTELTAYARSLLAAALACSNTLFWGWRGYFDNANELKPLLHTWSLGVEEQFYFAFPLLLMAVARLSSPRAIRVAILTLAALSFGASVWFVAHNPRLAFFVTPLRAWELMLGAILSTSLTSRPKHDEAENSALNLTAELAALLGLALILTPAVLYTDATAFPGLTALAPCLGTVLLIATGEHNTLIRRLLSLRPIVFLGLISYSVYLWHWPVIVFTNLHHNFTCDSSGCLSPVSNSARTLLFAATLLLGALSWFFVERPFRDRARTSTHRLVTSSATALALLLVFCTYALTTRGEPARFPRRAVAAADYLAFDTFQPWRWSTCALALDESPSHYRQSTCLPYTPGRRHYLLLGDSHAAQLWPGLHTIFPELEIGQLNVAGCNLLPYKQQDNIRTCRDMARYAYRDLLPTHRIDTLILSAAWTSREVPYIDELITYARAQHIELILIGPNSVYTLPAPRLLARLEVQSRVTVASRFVGQVEPTLDRELARKAAQEWHVPYLSFFREYCSPAPFTCPGYTPSGDPILLDTNHLTPAGATMLATTLRDRRMLP